MDGLPRCDSACQIAAQGLGSAVVSAVLAAVVALLVVRFSAHHDRQRARDDAAARESIELMRVSVRVSEEMGSLDWDNPKSVVRAQVLLNEWVTQVVIMDSLHRSAGWSTKTKVDAWLRELEMLTAVMKACVHERGSIVVTEEARRTGSVCAKLAGEVNGHLGIELREVRD